jgi:hypothetical protein
LLREIDEACLLDAIRDQDLANSDCKRLGYDREKLAQAALEVIQDGFAAIDMREIKIRDNVALTVHSTPHLVVLRCLNRTIRQAVRIRPADRDTVIRCLATILAEGVPHRLYKLDIKKFFESIGVLDLFAQLANEPRIPRNVTLILQNFLIELVDRRIVGVPRGVPLSATLSEYLMMRFDSIVSRSKEVYFYARYVDDIIIITGAREDKTSFNRFIRRALPKGLSFNSLKTTFLDIPVQHKSNGAALVGSFDYLGYNFSIHETVRVDNHLSRAVDVTLAPRKVRRIKSRVSRAVANFTLNGDTALLERRMQLLTGNYNLRDSSTGRIRNVGLYCNYRRANSMAALVELDSFLRSVFVGERGSLSQKLSSKMSYKDRRSFLRYSFTKSFHDRTFYNFPPAELVKLTVCWRDA